MPASFASGPYALGHRRAVARIALAIGVVMSSGCNATTSPGGSLPSPTASTAPADTTVAADTTSPADSTAATDTSAAATAGQAASTDPAPTAAVSTAATVTSLVTGVATTLGDLLSEAEVAEIEQALDELDLLLGEIDADLADLADLADIAAP